MPKAFFVRTRRQATGNYTHLLTNRVNYLIEGYALRCPYSLRSFGRASTSATSLRSSIAYIPELSHSIGKTPDASVWAYTSFFVYQSKRSIIRSESTWTWTKQP